MGQAAGLGLQSRRYNPGHFFPPVGGFSPASRLDLPEALQSLFIESSPPERRSVAVDLQLGGDLQILFALTSQEQNPRAQHHLLRSELGANPFLQLIPVAVRELYKRRNFRHAANIAQKIGMSSYLRDTTLGYNVGVAARPAFLDADAIFFETQNRENQVAVVTCRKMLGMDAMGFAFEQGWRVQESYAKTGKELGIRVAKKVK